MAQHAGAGSGRNTPTPSVLTPDFADSMVAEVISDRGHSAETDGPAMQALLRVVEIHVDRCTNQQLGALHQKLNRVTANLQEQILCMKMELNSAKHQDLIGMANHKLNTPPHSSGATPREQPHEIDGAIQPVKDQVLVMGSQMETMRARLHDLEVTVETVDSRAKQAVESAPAQGALDLQIRRALAEVVEKRQREERAPELEQEKEEETEDTAITGAALDHHLAYTMAENMYDASLFIFTGTVGLPSSIITLLTLLMMMVFQFAFSWFVMWQMSENPVSNEALNDLLLFRASNAHDVKFGDTMRYQPMVAQICKGDRRLHMAGDQAGLIEDLDIFLDNEGPVLSVMAQMAWIIMMLNELSSAVYFLRGIMAIKTGPTTALVCGMTDGEPDASKGARIDSVSRVRKAFFFLCLVLPRVGICLYLTYAGVGYLGVTASLSDLVLNAIALGFLIDINELMFKVFVPDRVKTLITSLEPVELPSARSKFSYLLPAVQYVTMGMLVFGVLYIREAVIAPFTLRLKQADELVCGGKTGFVFARNEATTMVHEATTMEWQKQPTLDLSILAVIQRAEVPIEKFHSGWLSYPEVRDVLEPGADILYIPESDPNGGFEARYFEFNWVSMISKSTVAEASTLLPCADLALDISQDVMLQQLEFITGQPEGSLENCTALGELCFAAGAVGNAIRALCPITCMCYDPGPRFFSSPGNGCSQVCIDLGSATFYDRECEDLAWPEWYNDPQPYAAWGLTLFYQYARALINHVRAKGNFRNHLNFMIDWLMSSGYLISHVLTMDEYIDYIATNETFLEDIFSFSMGPHVTMMSPVTGEVLYVAGCDFFLSTHFQTAMGLAVCKVTEEFQSLRFICPTACRCDLDADLCPLSCGMDAEGGASEDVGGEVEGGDGGTTLEPPDP